MKPFVHISFFFLKIFVENTILQYNKDFLKAESKSFSLLGEWVLINYVNVQWV